MPGETGHTDIARVSPAEHPYVAKNASQPAQDEPSYYDISFLQPPPWKWEIVGYFFFGGVSGAAYVLSRMADRFGGEPGRSVARAGAWVSMLSFLPCPPLLIHDLGDRKRFHHMLRVFKPASPMSFGSWILTTYSAFATLNLGRQILRELPWIAKKALLKPLPKPLAKVAALVPASLARQAVPLPLRAAGSAVDAADDLLGVPLAVMLAGYTGVLLSCSANPLWAQNPWIGPLFSASAASTGAAAVSAAMTLTGNDPESPAAHALEKLDSIAHAAELATFAGFVEHDRAAARPLTHGPLRTHMLVAGGLIAAAEVLKHVDVPKKARKYTALAAAAAGLAAGLHLRWAFVYGGHAAAADPRAARTSSRPRHRIAAKFPHPPSLQP
jgi:formate-dependent nitrite reductase membrane component NrfD